MSGVRSEQQQKIKAIQRIWSSGGGKATNGMNRLKQAHTNHDLISKLLLSPIGLDQQRFLHQTGILSTLLPEDEDQPLRLAIRKKLCAKFGPIVPPSPPRKTIITRKRTASLELDQATNTDADPDSEFELKPKAKSKLNTPALPKKPRGRPRKNLKKLDQSKPSAPPETIEIAPGISIPDPSKIIGAPYIPVVAQPPMGGSPGSLLLHPGSLFLAPRIETLVLPPKSALSPSERLQNTACFFPVISELPLYPYGTKQIVNFDALVRYPKPATSLTFGAALTPTATAGRTNAQDGQPLEAEAKAKVGLDPSC